MYEFNKEDYRRIYLKYMKRFLVYFPSLDCWCGDIGFGINGRTWKFSEITGLTIRSHYMVIEIRNKYGIYLPVSWDAYFHIGEIDDD